MNQTYEQIIIGAGFAGICMAIRLKEAGMKDFIILERNPHLGGTWWDNHYPGAACDVESHLYSYSFEPNPKWSRQFSPQEEILGYLEHCVFKYQLEHFIQYDTAVINAVFNEAEGMWNVSTEAGETFTASSLVSCTGGLSQVSYPDIKGLNTFKGSMFHSARWDKDFELKGKTVAVIGTGASAIQIVPAIATEVKQLLLFQRTPPWVIRKPDKPISERRKWLYHSWPFIRALYRFRLYWMHEMMAIGFDGSTWMMKIFGKIALRYLKNSVPDPELRRKLTPNYIIGCKRILLSNDYYPALQRANVSLITEHIDNISQNGINTADGIYHPLDAIVLATGFQASEGIVGMQIKGRNGIDLNEAWKDGAEAYLGTSVSGFPNLYLVVGPNTGLGHSSMILMIEAQVNYILQALQLMKEEKVKYTEVKKNVEDAYNEEIQKKLSITVWQAGGCHSWYQNKKGKNVTLWPGFTFTFMQRTKRFEKEKYEWVR